ncbi:MAG: hypothetical protein KF819_16575 [Labilithrix sp.]|nr:hypothetical protein [Labilithrix sp.]
MAEPSMTQLDLFRTVEDIHELAQAIVVLLTDREGVSIAVSGDEDDIPPPLRAVLSGKGLAAAGSVRALLEPIGEDLASWPINFSILPVGDAHVLAIAFDAEADLDVVQRVAREGAQMIAEILSAATDRAVS